MKIVNPTLPSGHVLFCDDIREEVTGKITYIGGYANVMFVRQIPATIPQFCIMVTLRTEIDDTDDLTMKVIYEVNGEDRLLVETLATFEDELPLRKPDEFTMREFRSNFVISPLQLEEPGRIKVRAYKGDNELRLGSLRVERAPETPSDSPAPE